MFDKLINELNRLNNFQVSVPIDVDEDGYFDRECPDNECLFQFKVNDEDWKNIFKDEAVFCPMCGGQSTSNTFNTTEQVENATRQGMEYFEGRIDKAIVDGAKDFNRRQPKGGFISMSIKVTGTKPEKIILPIPAREAFERKISCEKCNSRYAVIGSAFFCPSCGHNSVEKTFDNSMETIESSIKSIDIIKDALSKISKDTAETTCRSLIEKGLLDCVVSFQRFCDIIYKKQPNAKSKVPFNAFQKIDVGEGLWKDLLQEGYSDWLTKHQFDRMNILFQRRHLLQHTEGIVDQMYTDKTSDPKYKLGQRIVINESDVPELVGYIKTLTTIIKQKTV
jgi:uncharacterized Zn finger protein (UPF0148 family)